MKRFIVILFIITTSLLHSEINFILGPKVSYNNNLEDINRKWQNLYPGLFWEVNNNKFGFGMTYDIRLIDRESLIDENDEDWFLDWRATLDLKYYIFGADKSIQPYFESSLGVEAKNLLEYYDTHKTGWIEDEDGNYIYREEGKDIEGESLQDLSLIGTVKFGTNIAIKKSILGFKVGTYILDNNIHKGNLKIFDSSRKNFILSIYLGHNF